MRRRKPLQRMNDVIDAIRSRRSLKKFDPVRSPTPEQVDLIIEAATWAPNHRMTEPWRFVVVSGQARVRLAEAMVAGLRATSKEPPIPERVEQERAKALSAPVILTLIGCPKVGENIVPQEELVAAGAAMQNMLLAAHSLGLAASVKTGAHSYSEEVARFFELKAGETLVAMVHLGYSAGVAPPGKRSPYRDKVVRLES